jgi:hypothetical protein
MTVGTAIDSGSLEGPSAGCACCGNPMPDGLVRLGHRPDVAVCYRCVRWLARQGRAQQRELRRMDRGLHRRLRSIAGRRQRHC